MKLTKETLRGVIREVMKEEVDLGASGRGKATRSSTVQQSREKAKTVAGSKEVSIAELQVLETVMDKLREIAQQEGINLATGGMRTLLQRMLDLIEKKAETGSKTEEPGYGPPVTSSIE